jgi:hypothetical protein
MKWQRVYGISSRQAGERFISEYDTYLLRYTGMADGDKGAGMALTHLLLWTVEGVELQGLVGFAWCRKGGLLNGLFLSCFLCTGRKEQCKAKDKKE